MGKILITDEALEQAAESVRESMLNAVLQEEPCRHEFSPEFEEKIRQLQGKKHKQQRHRTIARRIAAVFLAIVLGAGIWLASSGQARAAISRWFREVQQSRVVYHFTGEVPGGKLPEYRPKWVPDGYEMVRVFGDDNTQSMVYQKGEDVFSITYYWMSEGTIAVLLNAGEGRLVSVDQNQGYFYPAAREDTTNDLIWADERANIQFLISAYLEEEEILRIAESVKLSKAIK